MAQKEFIGKITALRREIKRLEQAKIIEQQRFNTELANYGLLATLNTQFDTLQLYNDRIVGDGQTIKISPKIKAEVVTSGSRFATSGGSRSTLTRTVAGGVIAGPLGAVVGANNKKQRKDVIHDDRSLHIIIDAPDGYIDAPVDPNKIDAAHRFIAEVKLAIINRPKKKDSGKMKLAEQMHDAEKASDAAIEEKQKELDELIENASDEEVEELRRHEHETKMINLVAKILIMVVIVSIVCVVIWKLATGDAPQR